MSLTPNPGLNPPPLRSPILEFQYFSGRGLRVPRSLDEIPEILEQAIKLLEGIVTTTWARYFALLESAINSVTTGVYGGVLTPAATVVPVLDGVSENGTFSLLLNRTTTTISPATLGSAYPPDFYRFSIVLLTDGTDGRLVVWDPLYLGANEAGWEGAPDQFNCFSFITLPSGAGFLLSAVPSIGIT